MRTPIVGWTARALWLAAGAVFLLIAAGCSAIPRSGVPAALTPAQVLQDSTPGASAAASAAPAVAAPGSPSPPRSATPTALVAAGDPTATRTPRPTPSPTPLLSTPQVAGCPLTPVVAPTSAPNPGPNRLDRSTGLHMTGHVRRVQLSSWRLKVTGKVANPLIMTYDQLRCLPRVQETVDLGCPGYFLDTATWAGARLADVLALARPDPAATQLELVSADNYVTELPLKDALVAENLVAYEWEGQPVPILHGFPARAVIPNYDGSTWAKWLVEIRVK